jgi:glutamate 5-kinase
VARLLGADALVLLSDVEALYTAPPEQPGATRIDEVPFGDELAAVTFGSIGTAGVGTGGAGTKVAAARLAAEAGTAVLVTDTALVDRALAGEHLGTWFHAAPRR